MTQKSVKFFINEVYSKGPKTSYPANKNDVYHIDDIWSLGVLDFKDYRYVLKTRDDTDTFCLS